METTVTKENDAQIRLTIDAPASEVQPAIDRAVRSLSSQIKIPGFRQGKAPRKIVESKVGPEVLKDEVLREALPMLLAKALADESEIHPIAPPRVDVKTYEVGGDITFEATVDVRPTIAPPNLELLTATRPNTAASDEEIDEQLTRLQDRFASLDTVERPAVAGDHVLIDITTTIADEPLPMLTGNDQSYEVGSGALVEEFDTQLTGSKAGDILAFEATLPEGAGEHGGKVASFNVLVKEVRQKNAPELDDEFAKTASEFDTLDELRADLNERISKVKEGQADGAVRDAILNQVIDDADFPLPESLVTDEMAYRLQRFEQQLQQIGQTLDQYLETSGFDEEQLESDLRTQAERNVRAQLLLESVGEANEITVTQEEIEAEVSYQSQAMRIEPDKLAETLRDPARLRAMAGDIIRRKALNFLVENADIKQEGDEAPGTEPEETGPDSETASEPSE